MNTYCRLWIHVPLERRDALERRWQEQLAPRLDAIGLKSAVCTRPLPEGVVAWVLVIDADHSVVNLRTMLQADPVWRQALSAVAAQDSSQEPRWGLDLFSTPAVEQAHPIARGTRQGPWLMLDPHDGMPSCLISDLATDHRGHLYMAAYEGLVHFDGATATLFSVAGGTLQFLQFVTVDDEAADVWLCPSEPGLVRWDGEQFLWYGAADGLPEESYLLPCNGAARRLWVCRSSGVAIYFDCERFERIDLQLPAGTEIHCAWSDEEVHLDGRHLLVATDRGVWRTGTGARCLGLAGERVSSLCRDGRGILWVSAGDAIYRQTADGFETVPAIGTIRQGSRLIVDRNGGLLFLGQDSGVRCWNGHNLTTYGCVQGSSTHDTAPLHLDDRGALWLAAWGTGLSRFDGHWIGSVDHESPSGERRVETVCEDADGRIWIGTWGGGVMRVEGDRACVIEELADCGAHLWSSLQDRQGNLWFGSYAHGAGCWDGEHLRLIGADRLGHASVWAMHQDRHGRMWFATQGGGLTCLDGEDTTTYTTADGLPDDRVWSVIEDATGDIWCSTLDSGVSRFDGHRFHSYNTRDGLAHDQVWCMLCDRDGDLWFGTWGGGVSRYDGQRFTTFTMADGLANNSVRAIHQSRDGHMWFGTYGGGVSRFDGRVFQTFARRDGLGHDAVQSITEAADGTMWIATDIGVCSYTPPTRPPTVDIDGLVADRRYDTGEDAGSVRAAQGLVTIEFSGASLTTPRDRLIYIYRLQGHDVSWQTTTRRRVELHDLAEGEHVFQVQAVDRDLNYSPTAEIRFRVDANSDSERLRALQAELAVPPGLEHFIGCSASLQRVFDEIETVAGSDLTVLILGETGTGKGLVARGIHAMSACANGPFIQVNCGAIPEGLVESELFGHEKGAFTGAVARKIGRFELAEGGTLFLDEIGDLPLASQRVLLHALQEAVFHRVGGQAPIQADVRVIAATNRRLDQARDGIFRDDLYFRLSPFILRVPPLRDRQEDIPLLLGHFVESFSRHLNRPMPDVSPDAIAALQAYEWPGNVRELEHVAQRAVLVCRGGVIGPRDLAVGDVGRIDEVADAGRSEAVTLDELDQHLSELERAQLLRVLEETNWVIYGERGAARRLDTHPEKLRRRLRRLGLRRAD